jgi:hypothetical protein
MKKTSIFTLAMVAMGLMANAQSRDTTYPAQVWDGMDSIVVHYNPFGTGGDAGDTTFQTTAGPLYAYCYLTDSTAGSGGHVGTYNNGTWLGVVIPIDSFVKVTATDWMWVMPNVRQFFSVPSDVYVTGVNLIVHNATGSVQSANIFIPVIHTGMGATGINQQWTTGPNTIIPGTLLPSSTENIAIYYHPQSDTAHFSGSNDGDVIFKTFPGTLYAYTWARTAPGSVDYPLTAWGSVGSTPADSLVRIDSNNYVYDIKNLVGDFMSAGMPSGTTIDTIGFIPRTASGDTQTVNMYIPLVITATSTGVVNVNANNAKVSIVPNPATSAMLVSYAFAQQADVTVRIDNLLGQTVMTQHLGNNQVGNVYLSVDNYPSGIYLVTVSNGIDQIVQRLSKQ